MLNSQRSVKTFAQMKFRKLFTITEDHLIALLSQLISRQVEINKMVNLRCHIGWKKKHPGSY